MSFWRMIAFILWHCWRAAYYRRALRNLSVCEPFHPDVLKLAVAIAESDSIVRRWKLTGS